MKIRDVEYVGAFGWPAPLPREARPEVALFGRSNVGKSSLVNALLGRRALARTSRTPGRTRAAHFYRIDGRFHLVDMPGYGYARAPAAEVERLRRVLRQYVEARDRRNAFVQILDPRHEPTDDDVASVARILATGRPLCLVFTKIDKVPRGRRRGRIAAALRVLDVPDSTAVVPFSSVTREGRRELWHWIAGALGL